MHLFFSDCILVMNKKIIDIEEKPKTESTLEIKSETPIKSEIESESESEIESTIESVIESAIESIIESTIESQPEISSQPKTKNDFLYHNLVLSGGSTRGIAHIGAIRKLIDLNLLDLSKLRGLASTSAGSMLGVLVVLGFTIDEIWSFIQSIDFEKLVSPNLSSLAKCGIDSGQIIYNLIEEILSKTTHIHNINFDQLYKITNITYTVVGSCLTTKEAVYYNHINTPNFKVSLAVRISMGMPGFFTPVVIDKYTYIDGAVIDNYPIELFHEDIDRTIGIIICNDYDTEYTYPEEYIGAVMNLFVWMCYKKDEMKYRENTIYIRNNSCQMSMFDFNLDLKKKIQFINRVL